MVTTRIGDCLHTGKPSRYITKPRSTQPSIPPGYINRLPAFLAGVKVGARSPVLGGR